MALSEKQKKHLRRLAHPMNPIVMLGNAGLTDGVVNELDRALTDHELVKVTARVGEREARWRAAPAPNSCSGSATSASSTAAVPSCRKS
jgi:putative YhbY family RNA-binding protein